MRTKQRRFFYYIAALILLAAVITIGVRFFADEGSEPTENVVMSARFTRPTLMSYKDGLRWWTLKAESVEEQHDETGVVKLKHISDGILFREGEPHVHFSADEGTWHQGGGALLLTGNVHFIQGDQRLTADSLTADMETDTMHFVGNVHWRSDDGTDIVADEAVYDTVDDMVEFRGMNDPVILTKQE